MKLKPFLYETWYSIKAEPVLLRSVWLATAGAVMFIASAFFRYVVDVPLLNLLLLIFGWVLLVLSFLITHTFARRNR